jgi:hypothetical protein
MCELTHDMAEERHVNGVGAACARHAMCELTLILNYDQKDATILAYLFIHNQLYMFRAMSSPIIRSS